MNSLYKDFRFSPTQFIRTSKWPFIIIVVIVGLFIRFWGIHFGLPSLYHPDEPEIVVIAQRMFKTGDLNPHFFLKPSLPIYLNALAYIPYYLVGKSIGLFQSRTDIPSPILLAMGVGQATMPSTWLLGRSLTAIIGSAAIILVFLIGRHLAHNWAVGLLAAILIAISPTNVTLSRYITHDTFVVFFLLLSFWGSVKLFEEGKTWQYVAAGVAGGLAASAKYNGSLILLTVILAHLLRSGLKRFKDYRLYLALASSVIAFLMTTPFAILDYQRFFADLQRQARIYSSGHAGMEGDALKWYLAYLWRVEGPLCLLAAIQILHGIYSRSRPIALLSSFPVLYFSFITLFVVRNDRTLLPVIPFLILLASMLLVGVVQRSSAFSTRLRAPILVAAGVLTVISLALPSAETIKRGMRLTTVDSRETARKWLADNLPSGAKVAIESYAPFVDPGRFSVKVVTIGIYHPPEWYVSNGFDYLILSHGMFGRFYREPDRYSRQVSQYEELFRAFEMVKTFDDGGYEIRVYRLTER